MENWHTLATSSKPEVPSDDNQVHVYQAGLGDITIGLTNQNQNMLSQQQNLMSPAAHEPMTAGGSPSAVPADPFKAQKPTEDLFLKSNLEYEQRLKQHLYQFDNPRQNESQLDETNISDNRSRQFNNSPDEEKSKQ